MNVTYRPSASSAQWGVRPTDDAPVTSVDDEMGARMLAFVRGPLSVMRRQGDGPWEEVARS